MKNGINGLFSCNFAVQGTKKLQEKFFFRVISAFAPSTALRAMADKSRFSRARLLCLFTGIFAVVSVFAESYPNRPTEYEMEGIVILGKECVLGVNERCYATQTSTNPTYSVSPPFTFTNGVGLYLNQSTMGQIASAAKSLVQYYANPNTVYNGTTNITMLTTPGLFTELDIGNHTNQFTQTFASGTNSAVYGDSPWRIYAENLVERYEVLNALSCGLGSDLSTRLYPASAGRGLSGDYDNELSYSALYYGGNKPYLTCSNLQWNVKVYSYVGLTTDDYLEFNGVKLNDTNLCVSTDNRFLPKVGSRVYKSGIFIGSFSIGEQITIDVWDTIGGSIGVSGNLVWDWDFQYCTDE